MGGDELLSLRRNLRGEKKVRDTILEWLVMGGVFIVVGLLYLPRCVWLWFKDKEPDQKYRGL